MLNKIVCKLFGHKEPLDVVWAGIYGDTQSSKHGECPRCGRKLIMYPGVFRLAGWVEES